LRLYARQDTLYLPSFYHICVFPTFRHIMRSSKLNHIRGEPGRKPVLPLIDCSLRSLHQHCSSPLYLTKASLFVGCALAPYWRLIGRTLRLRNAFLGVSSAFFSLLVSLCQITNHTDNQTESPPGRAPAKCALHTRPVKCHGGW